MRSVKKLLKKAMVFTLTAAMLVGTPLTASAAPLNSVYSIGDHWGGTVKLGEDGDTSHTGTVTNTATTTQSGVLKDNETKILGIALDKTHLDMVAGEQETLTATILLDADKGELALKYEEENTEKALEILKKMIRWEVQNADVKVDGTTNKTLSIRAAKPEAGDAMSVILNPRQGTKAGKDMKVVASLEGSWYLDAEGNLQELTTNKTEGHSAVATVSIKEYTRNLSWSDNATETKTYVKHTVDLGSKLVRDPATANDTITWTSTNTQFATVNAQGVVTVKNIGAAKLPATCTIIAMGEKGAKATRTLKIEQGTAVSKIEIYKKGDKETVDNKKIDWDLKDYKDNNYQASQALEVKAYATVKGVVVKDGTQKEPATSLDDAKKKANGDLVTGNLQMADGTEYYLVKSDDKKALSDKQTVTITDVITWSSNKVKIADVNPTSGKETTVTSKGEMGNAAITAKASSGKNAKVTFAVKGTLDKLEIGGLDVDTLYSGQTKELTAIKYPANSKDGIKWSIKPVEKAKGNGTMAHPNVTINGKGKLTVKNQLKTDKSEWLQATILLESSKKENGESVVKAEPITINLKQSSIKSITVVDETDRRTVAGVSYPNDDKNTKADETKGQKVDIKVPLNHSFQATVKSGFGNAGADEATLAGTLDWTSSKKNVVDIVDNGVGRKKIVAKAAGSTDITVTGLRAMEKDGKIKSVNKISVKFKVTVTQPVQTITMNKPAVTLAYQTQKKGKNEVTKAQNVALKVTLGPKGVASKKEIIDWGVEQTAGTMKTEKDDEASIKMLAGNKVNTKANATVVLLKPEVGDEYVVTAKASTGVVATSTIKIVQKTVGVEIASNASLTDYKPVTFKNNKTATEIGKSFQIHSFVNVGESAKKPLWEAAGSENCENVTYSVNKKGIVSVDSQGNVIGLGKGTVKITAKTPMGKSKAITVVVDVPADK